MRISRQYWPLFAATILLPFHLKLNKSEPGKDATLDASPKSVKLWFSESVELPATSVSVTDAAKKEVKINDLEHAEDGAVVAPVGSELSSGKYSVSWRTMAKDGHVIRGVFGFSVK